MGFLLTAFTVAALPLNIEANKFKHLLDQRAPFFLGEQVIFKPKVALTPPLTSIKEFAKEVTIRVLNANTAGSGAIIGRQKDIYSILTCDHVVNHIDQEYKVLTSDGITYPALVKRSAKFNSIDVAIVEFRSSRLYKVAPLGNIRALSPGNIVYAAGYPNYHFPNSTVIESTHHWGTKAFLLTMGKISIVNNKSMLGGYSLGYTNTILGGMSGGPILNQQGQLIGINGRLPYPLQGIDAYIFTDSTKPNQALFEKMEPLSWGIPINTLQPFLSKLKS